MIKRILLQINSFLLTIQGFSAAFLITLFIGTYLYDCDYQLKKVETSETVEIGNGVLALEFADSLETRNLIEGWIRADTVSRAMELKIGQKPKIQLANSIIIWDFLFIIMYSILIFMILNRTFQNYDMSIFGKEFNCWFKINHERFFVYIVLALAFFDIFENIVMLLNIHEQLIIVWIIRIKTTFVKLKFILIGITILLTVFVNINKQVFDFLIDPNTYLKKLLKPFSIDK